MESFQTQSYYTDSETFRPHQDYWICSTLTIYNQSKMICNQKDNFFFPRLSLILALKVFLSINFIIF